MTWFNTLTGLSKESPENVREHLSVQGETLHSAVNGRAWHLGRLDMPTLSQLRDQARQATATDRPTTVREVIADVQDLHLDPGNADALFQVASQFNLLEMASPRLTPEDGVGLYQSDHTQGPACAVAAGAGTIYRNYFADVNGRVGQSRDNQVDCLAGFGELLGNTDERLWRMENGYALASMEGLEAINATLGAMDEAGLDRIRAELQIGLQLDTEVTLQDAGHRVSQAYCSALPVAYSHLDPDLWARFAKLVLEAAYEATLCAAIVNAGRTGNPRLYLTLLGGGAFGNEPEWIIDAIERAVAAWPGTGLDIVIVSYGYPNPDIQRILTTN